MDVWSVLVILSALWSTSSGQQRRQQRQTTTVSPLSEARRLADNNPALHRLNDQLLLTVFSGQNEVVCVLCLLHVLAAADRIGSVEVQREIRRALQSEHVGELGEVLQRAIGVGDDQLEDFLSAYYNSDALPDCQRLPSTRRRTCFRQSQYLAANGRQVDFADASTVREINADVERATNGKIPDLFQRLSRRTRLVFASALVFAAKWPSRLASRPGKFLPAGAAPGRTQDVDMLVHEEYLATIRNEREGVVGVALPYETGPVRLLLFKTTTDAVDIRRQLYEKHLRELNDAQQQYVHVEVPKFDVRSKKRSYVDLAETMNISTMFREGLGPQEELRVDQLVHKAVISTDEHGTSAAGAAGIAFVPLSAKPTPLSLVFDRPFVAVLYHSQLDVPLFSAYITNPNLQ